MSYCKYVELLESHNLHKVYHDKLYGVRIENDDELFCRLIMEINQAGLSWDTILKKENNLRVAYSNFDILKVANYKEKDFARLMSDTGIIRNRLKINAAIHNANIILSLQKEMLETGEEKEKVKTEKYKDVISFRKWLDIKKDNKEFESAKDAVKTFKKAGFKFVGGEIINEFLMSLNLLSGAHDKDCKFYKN